MIRQRQLHVLLALGFGASACRDSVGPGCGRCLPFTALAIDGQLTSTGGPLPPATVRLRMLDPVIGLPRDTLAGCIGTIIRDTTVAIGPAANFRTVLYAGFPVFDVCLEVRVLPTSPGAFSTKVLSYPFLALRDTSLHDTLHISVRIP